MRVEHVSTGKAKTVEASSTEWKKAVEASSTRNAGKPSFPSDDPVEASSTHIFSQSGGLIGGAIKSVPAGSAGVGEAELRAWVHDYLRHVDECGAQSRIAEASGVPQSTLSKFLAGRGLPERHRMKLQTAVGARWPHNQFSQRQRIGFEVSSQSETLTAMR